MTILASIPLPLLSTPPSPQKVLHRLVYHSLSASHETRGQSRGGNSTIPLVIPRKVITLEVELAGPQSSNPRGYSDPLKASKLLERIFDKPGIGETTDSADEPPADLGEGVSPSSPISSNARYTSGIQVEVNLLMPDRYAGPSCRPSRDVWLNAKPLSGPWICNLSRRDQQKCRCRNALTR